MKQLWAVIPMLFLSFVLAGCEDNSPAIKETAIPSLDDTEVLRNVSMEVLRNVYDDLQSTIYIKVDMPSRNKENATLVDIMVKKKEWELLFPNKKVLAMSIVNGTEGGYGHSVVVGLLIHYEQR